MELFTILGYISGAFAFGFAIYFMYKHNELKALKNTISNLETENQSLRNLIVAKDKTIEQFTKDLQSVKNQMQINIKVMECKIEDIKKELDQLKTKSQLLENELLAKDAEIRSYRETLVHVKDKCPQPDCDVCNKIERILMK